MKLQRLNKITAINGVPVYAHWSVILIAALVLIGAIERPQEIIAASLAYFGVLLIHECGHMVAARRKGCKVYSIELYPIIGFVRFQEPWSRYDHALIAWGGVMAQAAVAIPSVVFLSIFGFTRFDALNVALGILGPYSLMIAVFNLLPIRPLDGATAWYLVPELFKRVKRGRNKAKRAVGWRGW